MNRVPLPSFADLRIRTKLAIGFGAVLVVAAMVALVGGFAVVSVRDSATDARQNGDELNAAALAIQGDIARAEKGVSDMVRAAAASDPKKATAKYAPIIRGELTSAQAEIDKTSGRWKDPLAAQALGSLLSTFSRQLDALLPAIELRGNPGAGQEGAFWEQTRTIEDQVAGRAGAERTAAAALAVRRAANEWIALPDDASATRVRSAMTALKAEFDTTAALRADERTSLKATADAQATSFNALVEADGQLRQYVQLVDAQGGGVNTWTTNIAKNGLAASESGRHDIESTSSEALRTVAIITVIGLIMAALLVIVLSRLITGPLVRLSEVSNRMSLGELDVQIDVQGNDEVGQLADSLRRMQTSLRAAIERLRARRAA